MARAARLRRRLAATIAVLVVAIATPALAGPAAAFEVGISDQSPITFDDFRLAALPIDHARLVVPWDVAFTNPASVDAWMAATATRGLVSLVAFEHAATDRCPGTPCALPTAADYGAALEAFHDRWPQVTEWTPWNEPNHPSQPTADVPVATARLVAVAARVCPGCRLVVGDFVDSASMKGYFRDYRGALDSDPAVWGIHDYGDVTYERASYTTWLLDQVSGDVWITETGGIVRLTAGGVDQLPYDEARAARSIDRAFALAESSARIRRMYFYNWRAGPWELFDAGLTTALGASRPSLERVFAHLGVRRPVVGAAGEESGSVGGGGSGGGGTRAGAGDAGKGRVKVGGTDTQDAATAHPARLRALHLVRGGLRVRLSCPGRKRCRGRVLVYGKPFGHAARRLASRSVTVAARGGWVSVRVARPRLAALRGSRRGRVVVFVQLREPSSTVTLSIRAAALSD